MQHISHKKLLYYANAKNCQFMNKNKKAHSASYFFVCDLKIKANKNANPTAAAMPPAVAVSPPVKIPKNPWVLIAPIAPFAKDAPNPTIGTLIPALAKSEM